MGKLKIVSAFFSALIVTPIWYYLLYQILARVGASELMWFLFWVYVPVGLLATTLFKLTES